jgi:hypothetical protein
MARTACRVPGRYASPPGSWALASPSLFGLAPCGVYPARCLTAAAVRSYRTFSPLPRQGTCRPGEPERVSGGPAGRERHDRGNRGGIFSVALAVFEP